MAGRTIGQLKADKRSKKRQQADFLAWFSRYASVSRACQKAKVPRSNIYEWLKSKSHKTFQELYQAACQEALGALEDEAVRRAYQGVNRPVYQGGERVGYVKEYSDTLLIVLLKARAPEKYKDRVQKEHSGPGGGPIKVTNAITHNLVIKRCDK